MKDEKALVIRSYRASDRAAVRRLCCQTGFLGEPIDPVYEDHELFADFLTTYYDRLANQEPLVLEVEEIIRCYLPGFAGRAREPVRSFFSKHPPFSKIALALSLRCALAPLHSLDD